MPQKAPKVRRQAPQGTRGLGATCAPDPSPRRVLVTLRPPGLVPEAYGRGQVCGQLLGEGRAG